MQQAAGVKHLDWQKAQRRIAMLSCNGTYDPGMSRAALRTHRRAAELAAARQARTVMRGRSSRIWRPVGLAAMRCRIARRAQSPVVSPSAATRSALAGLRMPEKPSSNVGVGHAFRNSSRASSLGCRHCSTRTAQLESLRGLAQLPSDPPSPWHKAAGAVHATGHPLSCCRSCAKLRGSPAHLRLAPTADSRATVAFCSAPSLTWVGYRLARAAGACPASCPRPDVDAKSEAASQ